MRPIRRERWSAAPWRAVRLIFLLGVVETNLVAALIDLGVGAVALLWDRRTGVIVEDIRSTEHRVIERRSGTAVLLIASASGFCGLAYELLWTRGLMAAVTDDTTYAFTLMLSAYLAAHGGGRRRREPAGAPRSPGRSLAPARYGPDARGGEPLISIPLLVAIRDPINRAAFHEGMSFWGDRMPFHLVISLAVFAPSAFVLGASFTLAARLYVGRGRPVGTSTGRLQGFNTLGSVLGSIVATAWLVPTLGAQQAIIVLALFQASQGALAILFGGTREKAGQRRGTTSMTFRPEPKSSTAVHIKRAGRADSTSRSRLRCLSD